MKRLIIAALALLTLAASVPPTVTAPNITAAENAGTAVLLIQKTKASSYTKVTIQTADGTAKDGIDYAPVNSSVTLGNNTLTYRLPISIINNSTYQGSRSFQVKIICTRFGKCPTTATTVTINDDELPPVVPPVVWTKCADEGGTCYITGTANVRYGATNIMGSAWFVRSVTGSILCSNSIWGDPLPGTIKRCETDGIFGTGPAPTPPPVQCPDGTIVPAGQSCPTPPPIASACKPLTLAAADPPLPASDMLCTAVKTCQDSDYLASLAGKGPWAGPVPVVTQGQAYHVVRGLIWHIDDQQVVAWRPDGTNFVPGFSGGAFFDRSCFE